MPRRTRTGAVSAVAAARRQADERHSVARIPSRVRLPRDEVAEIQRMRLLEGALVAVEEHGYANASVSQITSSARVSRRTFYELFDDREACLVALVEHVVGILEAVLAQAGLEGLSWCERVRGALWAILLFFDREPALARVCVVEAQRGGARLQASRERVLARLAAAIDEGREGRSQASDCSPLTAEGLAGAALTIVSARLLRERPEPLAGLLGELMGMIVLPYLGGAAARREQTRAVPVPVSVTRLVERAPRFGHGDPLRGLPMRLTYRTARVLSCIASRPGVSNREVADYAGITDPGQISKLLGRLGGLGLTTNTRKGYAKGEPNAWVLTTLGQQVAQHLSTGSPYKSQAA